MKQYSMIEAFYSHFVSEKLKLREMFKGKNIYPQNGITNLSDSNLSENNLR